MCETPWEGSKSSSGSMRGQSSTVLIGASATAWCLQVITNERAPPDRMSPFHSCHELTRNRAAARRRECARHACRSSPARSASHTSARNSDRPRSPYGRGTPDVAQPIRSPWRLRGGCARADGHRGPRSIAPARSGCVARRALRRSSSCRVDSRAYGDRTLSYPWGGWPPGRV